MEFTEEQKELFDKNNIGNCSCLTKTPEWTWHKHYCPIYKNGRIKQLESIIREYIDTHTGEEGSYWADKFRSIFSFGHTSESGDVA